MQSSSMSSAADIGARIREARLAQRMSQAELAEKSNISLPHISEIELGKADIRLQGFIRIIEALQVSADSILKANVPLRVSTACSGVRRSPIRLHTGGNTSAHHHYEAVEDHDANP